MAGGRQQPARFLNIPDLLASSDPSQEGLLRIIGRLECYDIKHSVLWLQDHRTPSLQVAVDSSSIEPFPFKMGSLYQFIGEVDYRDVPILTSNRSITAQGGDEDTVVPITSKEMVPDGYQITRCVMMKALLSRCVEGLDMDVYMKAHKIRMRTL